MIKRIVVALGALALSALLLAGIPMLLIELAGNPIPSWDRLVEAFTMPDYGGRFLIGTVIPVAAWIAWATFAIGFLAEIPNQLRALRGSASPRHRVRVPMLGAQQKAAGVLIAAILAVFVPSTAMAAEPAHADSYAAASTSISQTAVHEAPAPAAQPATAEEAATPAAEQRVVESGDTLWAIAEEELGAGERYSEIFEASRDSVQPDGQQLSDPDLILPGWTVTIPGAQQAAPAAVPDEAPAPPEQAPVEAPVTEDAPAADEAPAVSETPASEAPTDNAAPAEDVQESTGPGFVTGGDDAPAEQPQTDNAEAPAAADVDEAADEADWVDVVADWRTIGGIGGVLAAGLLSLLGLRRMNQRRNRKPGTRVAMPDETISTVELELRAVENPEGMDAVDHALRLLGAWSQKNSQPLPALYALRLSESEINVFLEEPAKLPEPFVADTDDDMAWVVALDKIEAIEEIPSSPYPGLVTLGKDETDAKLMVDLERLGALNVFSADPQLQSAALTALALELATVPWADFVRVTLVGVAPELPEGLGSGRVRHVDDVSTLLHELRGQAREIEAALAIEGGEGVHQRLQSEAWAPEVIILGEVPAEPVRSELADLVTRIPRVGIAAISAGPLTGAWNYTISSTDAASLEIPDAGVALPLEPQLVGKSDYARILALFGVATEGEAVEYAPASAELELDEIPEPQPEAEAAIESIDEVEADTEVEVEADVEPAAAEAAVDEIEEPAAGAAKVAPARKPRLRLLGAVSLDDPQGEMPTNPTTAKQWTSSIGRMTELIAFLATRPSGHVSSEDLHGALWPGQKHDTKQAKQSRYGLANRTRKWLGQDPEGSWYFPQAVGDVYTLSEELSCDWVDFQRLVGDDPTVADTADLVKALSLVGDQPFTGVKSGRYVWAEKLRLDMISAVGDAAHELATRALSAGDIRSARMAAAVGRMVEPENEVLWRDGIRAEHLAGDRAGVERLVDQLRKLKHDIDPEDDLGAETQALVDQLHERYAMAK